MTKLLKCFLLVFPKIAFDRMKGYSLNPKITTLFQSNVCCAHDPDRAPLKEVLGGQYNYREGGRQVLRQGAKGRRRNRKWQCSKDPCAQKVSGGRTDPSPKYRWKVHG